MNLFSMICGTAK